MFASYWVKLLAEPNRTSADALAYLRTLIEMGLIEMQDHVAVLAANGHRASVNGAQIWV